MTATATEVTVRFGGEHSTSGTAYSMAVPPWASSAGQPRRAQVVREVPVQLARRSQVDACSGALLIMMATTNGKCRLSLEVAAPHHSSSITSWARRASAPPGTRGTAAAVSR